MAILDGDNAISLTRSVTLTEQVLDAILRGAIERRIPFGARLVEAEIAKELNVSRVPVREALRLLCSQGLVENRPYKGMCLITVDERMLEETLTVRHHLEVLAVTLAIKNLLTGRANLTGLQAALDEMHVAFKSGSASDMAAGDVGFHREILRMADSDTLLFMWETLARKFQMIVGIAWYSNDQKRICEQHEELMKLFKAKKLAPLLAVLEPHIMEGLEVGPTGGMESLEMQA
ncbi:GntR family transcriptional regulator [Caballeronia sordidicola]|uniref:Transcriptional regulator, GntR family n=1 Tax=Caballeronia sordidicola TaxID=196367 RepID=A0A226X023_CABSO|nr:GntR family transcriptional regulator [Caballeronia sordidicola]OXC76774.1 Transcriptional regulator, GntR family [Caballeronia sordidicola]